MRARGISSRRLLGLTGVLLAAQSSGLITFGAAAPQIACRGFRLRPKAKTFDRLGLLSCGWLVPGLSERTGSREGG
jgi:hypothetical protein